MSKENIYQHYLSLLWSPKMGRSRKLAPALGNRSKVCACTRAHIEEIAAGKIYPSKSKGFPLIHKAWTTSKAFIIYRSRSLIAQNLSPALSLSLEGASGFERRSSTRERDARPSVVIIQNNPIII